MTNTLVEFTFINGDERQEKINSAELADIVMDIVTNNKSCSFRWNSDTELETL